MKYMLVDGNNLMFRAYYALRLMDNRPAQNSEEPVDGEKYIWTNALHGFLMMLVKAIAEQRPTHLCVAFDEHAPTFRHEEYKEYKAGRKPMPEELRPQMRAIHALLPRLGIRTGLLAGFEADDIIGSLSLQATKNGIPTVIVSGDRDMLQLVDDNVSVIYLKKGISDTIVYDPAEIEKTYGFAAPLVADLKGLMGDASDNIPGVAGIGEKTAIKLLCKYGSLENTLDHAAEEKGKLGERLMSSKEIALFSKKLATIERNAPLTFGWDDCALPSQEDCDADTVRLQADDEGWQLLEKYALHAVMRKIRPDSAKTEEPADNENKPANRERIVVTDAAAWQKAVSDLHSPRAVCASRGENAVHFSAADDAREVLFDCVSGQAEELDLLQLAMLTPEQIAALENEVHVDYSLPEGEYITHDCKQLWHMGFACDFVFDTMLGAYVLNSAEKDGYALEALRESAALDAAISDAAAIYELYKTQYARLQKEGSLELFRTVELPFAKVLYDMENAGFELDGDFLRRLGNEYTSELTSIEKRVRELAEEESAGRFPAGEFDSVNLGSPKQLGEMLFDKLEMTIGGRKPRKTQRGYSTDADTLEQLAVDHALVREILNWRKYTKLKNTYILGLLKQMGDGKTSRVHTSFDQTATATGRISSLEPNLQNIPVRGDVGREIRQAFVAPHSADGEKWILVDGDYSQIELRVLAHMAEHEHSSKAMQQAFRAGQDIHTSTASEVFGVPFDQVTKEQRSAAKAVNFGIVYGISEFGLARNLGIGYYDAKEYIERYKERYPGIRDYMDAQVRLASRQGYITTLMQRRRYIPQLSGANYQQRMFGERVAMNSPIQGTAADILKLAMVRVSKALRESGLHARLILQVHDEIIIETPESEADKVREIMRSSMENSVRLDVPLSVEISCGDNWLECK